MNSRRRRLRLWGSCLTVIMVVSLLAGCTHKSESPEDVVKRYLGLLAAGKANQATKMVPVRGAKHPEIYTDAVLGAATTRLSRFSAHAEPTGRIPEMTRTVDVTYWLGHQKQQAYIQVRQRDSKSPWVIQNPLVESAIVCPGSGGYRVEARIGGVVVPGCGKPFGIYPGIYPVQSTGPGMQKYVAWLPAVLRPEGDSLDLSAYPSPRPTRALKSALLVELKSYLDRCLSRLKDGKTPDECPAVMYDAVRDDPKARILTYPGLDALELDGRPWDTTPRDHPAQRVVAVVSGLRLGHGRVGHDQVVDWRSSEHRRLNLAIRLKPTGLAILGDTK